RAGAASAWRRNAPAPCLSFEPYSDGATSRSVALDLQQARRFGTEAAQFQVRGSVFVRPVNALLVLLPCLLLLAEAPVGHSQAEAGAVGPPEIRPDGLAERRRGRLPVARPVLGDAKDVALREGHAHPLPLFGEFDGQPRVPVVGVGARRQEP